VEGALGRDGADVQLIEYDLVPGTTFPVRSPPLVGAGVDQLRQPVDVVHLGARRGVGHGVSAIDSEAVGRAEPGCIGPDLPPAAFVLLHGREPAAAIRARYQLDRLAA